MALSFQNQAGADTIWAGIEDAKEIVKSALIQVMRTESIDSSGINYDPLEGDIFSDEILISVPSVGNLPKFLSELMVICFFVKIMTLYENKKIECKHFGKKNPDFQSFNDKGFLFEDFLLIMSFILENLFK